MGNLEFNSQNVTRLLRIANNTSVWIANTNTQVQIIQAGYLRDLILTVQGPPTFTGTPTVDPWGPFSILSNIQVNSNVQAGIINVSGTGWKWVQDMILGLEQPGNTLDTPLVTPVGANASDNTFVYNAPTASSGVAAPNNANIQVVYWVPLAQKINTLDGYVGIWDLQDPSIQMVMNYTPNSTSSSTPFQLSNNQTGPNGTTPYYGAVGTNSVTIAAPSVLTTRVMYDPPLDARNDPEFGFVHSWYEELFNTAIGGSTVINWRALANSGYITRLVFGVADATNFAAAGNNGGIGVAEKNMLLSNAINFTVGNNAPVIVETAYEAGIRQFLELGHHMPQGVFFIDFLGKDLTMQNVLDTFTAGNINLQMNFNNAISSSTVNGGTSFGKVIRGMLQALQG